MPLAHCRSNTEFASHPISLNVSDSYGGVDDLTQLRASKKGVAGQTRKIYIQVDYPIKLVLTRANTRQNKRADVPPMICRN
jgi:hypothetical protein